jgi:hypothetical protein
VALLQPKEGLLTFEAEGQEGGRYHSRKLHVPGPTSGLTIGRGYDMKERGKQQIVRELKSAGVSHSNATLLSEAAGLRGAAAEQFIKNKKLEAFEISSETQLKLFNLCYQSEESVVKRISGKEDTKEAYGAVDWGGVDQAIKDLIVDLKFRGDYTPASRKLVQKHLANNDVEGLAAVMSDRGNWPNVPVDRFERRKSYISKALNALQERKRETSLPTIPAPAMRLPPRQLPATTGRLAGRYLV